MNPRPPVPQTGFYVIHTGVSGNLTPRFRQLISASYVDVAEDCVLPLRYHFCYLVATSKRVSDIRGRASVMAEIALTDITLRKLTAPAAGQVEVWDSKLPGFGVRITSTGTRSFVLVYRFQGRARRLTIGRYPTLGLAKARELAGNALLEIRKGNDPQQPPKDAVAAQSASNGNFTVVLDEYFTRYVRRRNKASTAKENERILRADFERQWAKKNIRDITKQTVRARVEEIIANGTPSAANHAFATIRAFFNWCVRQGHLELSPCFGLEPPARRPSRDRTLTDEEIAQVWHGASKVGWPFGPIVQLLILTAQRRGEVASMRWHDLDLGAGLWSMPAEFTKSNRAHTVPLTTFTRNLILSLPRVHDIWVFPGRGDVARPYIGFNKAKARLDDHVDIAPWTLHDLRRTTATVMAKLKVSPHVLEKLLNHTTGTLGGIAGVYNRFGYIDEMRDALERWERHLTNDIISLHVAAPSTHVDSVPVTD